MWIYAAHFANRSRGSIKARLAQAAKLLLACAALAATAGCAGHYPFGPEYFPRDLEIRVRGLVTQSRIHEFFGDSWRAPNREAILIEVASRTDWIRRAVSRSADAQLEGDFCDSNRKTIVVGSGLFFNGERTDRPVANQSPNPVTHPNLPTRNEAGLYVVEGYVYVRNGPYEVSLDEDSRDDPAQEFHDKFDLERNPRDICVYVRGGYPILTYYYESNKVRISKDETVAALQREL